MFKYLAFILLTAGASTCNSTQKTESNNTVEKSINSQAPSQLHDIWALKEIEGIELDTASFSSGVPTLEIFIDEKRASGYTGCNNYFGSIEILDDQQFVLGPIAATKKYCAGVNEQNFLNHLDACDNYKIEKLHLFLYKNDSLMLTFRKVD